MCEAALWSQWIHVGTLVGTKACHLLALSASGLLKVLHDHKFIGALTAQYGKNFHVRVTSAVPPHSPWPTDLKVHFTDVGDLLSQTVGIGLFRRALQNGTLSLSAEDEAYLESELRNDKCTLQYSDDGSRLERVVSVSNVSLSRVDGTILHQIGSWES